MRVLLVHNFYQQPGGEDAVFRAEAELLRQNGHAVATHTVDNDDLGARTGLSAAKAAIWNRAAADELHQVASGFAADVVHFHNTFPKLSPAAYAGARCSGAAVVQTLHNYRLLCPGATFLRDGRVCTDCLGKAPLPALRHRCYRGSLPATAATTAMIVLNRRLGFV